MSGFARFVYYNLGPGQRSAADALTKELGPLIRAQHGCASATFFGDDSDGQYGIFRLVGLAGSRGCRRGGRGTATGAAPRG